MASTARSTPAFVDTDVIVRYVTGDDPIKQAAAARLFERAAAGDIALSAPDTAIGDAAFVLGSPRLYRMSRADVADALRSLIDFISLRLTDRALVKRALDEYEARNIDFGDAMIIAAMNLAGTHLLYSYDRDFDRLPNVGRRDP